MPQDFNGKGAKAFIDNIRKRHPDNGREKVVMNTLEGIIVEMIRSVAKGFAQSAEENLSTSVNNSRIKSAELLNEQHVIRQLIKYIADAKGDAVHPVIKETCKTLAELSDADYNKPHNIFKAWIKGCVKANEKPEQIDRMADKAVKKSGRANPVQGETTPSSKPSRKKGHWKI